MNQEVDIVGTYANELETQACVDYATTVMRVRRAAVERHHCKTVDACSGYTLVASSETCDFIGCHNSFAVFTLLEQCPVRKKQGLRNVATVLISIKCEYVDLNGKLCKYLFQVLVEHDVCNHGYFQQMEVNVNGTLLLLAAKSDVYVVRVPSEMDDNTVTYDPSSNTYLYTSVLRAEVMHEKHSNSKGYPHYSVVKAKFHQQYANTICILTMERLDRNPECISQNGFKHSITTKGTNRTISTGSNVRESQLAGTNSVYTERPDHNGVDSVQRATSNLDQALQNSHELIGVLRIFNVEESIDNAYIYMEFSEAMCRTGTNEASYDPYAAPRGTVVDFCWEAYENDGWNKTCVFVMSNYGFVFAYCPVLLPGCVHSFRNKQRIVTKATTLMCEGYRMKDAPRLDSIQTPEDISLLIKSLSAIETNGFVNQLDYVEEEDGNAPVKLIPSVYRLETTDDVDHGNFESFTVINTEPRLELLAAATNGRMVLYHGNSAIKPCTSHFYRPGAKRDIQYLNYVHTYNTQGRFGASVQVSRVNTYCVAHSAAETCTVNVEDKEISLHRLVKHRISGNHIFTHSQPVIVASDGRRIGNHGLYMIQALYCYLTSHEELRHVKTVVTQLVTNEHIDITPALSDLPSSQTRELDFNAPKLPSQLQLGDAVPSYLQYAKEALNKTQSMFTEARKITRSSQDYKEKTVALAKQLGTIDTEIMLKLKTQTRLGQVVQNSVDSFNVVYTDIAQVLNTLQEYRNKVIKLKERAEAVQKAARDIRERRNRVIALERELMRQRLQEAEVNHLNDLSTQVYTRCADRMRRYITCKATQAGETQGFRDCVKRVVDEWIYDTLKANVESMEHTFTRLRDLNNRALELD
ncbi:hypothetical protein BBOV_II000560 [Babesia bovis T2Bo]|uniref:Uncharacterized protein n=1 Tax=Babesia bovis TaxID=5865 RepID=A7ASV5_BABBO|nr:hypothetical protein BBOV_II000560 [Babesia bovis T2Bo]EDO06016.1 hypothetical protein BBOV_II000560 [Babesia bovis T2Bo]|eukprot:XP_001609584.1 hypothetical protein [Babesia bovis T2Bo]